MKKLSIVVPVYYNEASLGDTVPRLLALESRLKRAVLELVFVDDGSGDRSLDILLDFQKHHPEKIRVVKLSRNFGSMAAIQAGFATASGDCVGVIAADLQDPPELFLEMMEHWERGVKAVFAVRQRREDPLVTKFFSALYYSLLRRFAIPGYPSGGFDFLLVDRQIVNEVNRICEKNTNFMTLIFWLGHAPVLLPYARRARSAGKSRWTLMKKMKLFIDSFVAFSYVPIRFLSVMGLASAFGAFLYGAYLVWVRCVYGIEVRGWTALMLVIVFAAGLQMLMLGVLGEYLWRALDETRRRPAYVVDRVFEAPSKEA